MERLSDAWLSEQIIRESHDAVIFSDTEGTVRLWNRGAEEMFGYPAGEALGRSLDLIIPENLRGRHWEGYRRVMATGCTKYGTDLLAAPGLCRDGSRKSLEFSMVILRDAEGNILGTAAVIRDVTARWHKDKELKGRLSALERGAAGCRVGS
jgi:PAS domain S-box-containing protein